MLTIPASTIEQLKRRYYRTPLFALLYVLALAAFGWASCYFCADYAAKAVKKVQGTYSPRNNMSYVEMPRLSFQLLPNAGHMGMIHMDISLEVDSKDAAEVEHFRLRIADRLMRYTERLNYDDIAQPRSIIWLRPSLLEEAREAGAPQIHDIIFREFVIL